MKARLYFTGLVVVCLATACGSREQSPRIVCDWDGKVVPTGFTFAEFSRTLAAEHGQVEATGYERLKTRSVLIDFTLLTNGTVLAHRVLALKTGEYMTPVVFFGLTNAPIPSISGMVPPSLQAVPPETWGTNVLTIPPASPPTDPASAP